MTEKTHFPGTLSQIPGKLGHWQTFCPDSFTYHRIIELSVRGGKKPARWVRKKETKNARDEEGGEDKTVPVDTVSTTQESPMLASLP